MTWPLCQLCQWSIQCSTYCSTNIGIFYDLPIWATFGSNLSIWVRKIEIESKNIVAGMDSFISAINDIYIKVKQGFVTKRRGFFSKCLFLCCLRLRVNDMTWLICQLCQWSIQYSTYCSTNIGVFFYDLPIWAIFGSNLSILVRRRCQFECGEQMYDYAAWKYWRKIHIMTHRIL